MKQCRDKDTRRLEQQVLQRTWKIRLTGIPAGLEWVVAEHVWRQLPR